VDAIAAPVRDRHQRLAGILCVLGLGGCFDQSRRKQACMALLRRGAADFGARLL
jgi:DNA-binding IclR family transcriptional regulator